MDTVAFRSRVALAMFIAAIIIQAVGIKPCLVYITSAFPTYVHGIEQSSLFLTLLFSLLLSSFAVGRLRYIVLVVIGALMFYAGYRAFFKTIIGLMGMVTAPMHLHFLWTSSSYVMFIILAWVVFEAYKTRAFNSLGLACSLALVCIGILYLRIGVIYLYS